MRIAYSLALLACIAGCATANRVGPSQMETDDANKPLVCETEKACTSAWRSAQVWVVQNSHWHIRTATDAVIDTFPGDEGAVSMAYVITREPIGGGKEQIKIACGCRNIFGCSEDRIVQTAKFKRFVIFGMS